MEKVGKKLIVRQISLIFDAQLLDIGEKSSITIIILASESLSRPKN